MATMTPRTQLYAAVVGTILVALCCFTPILVIAFAAVGLAAFTPYLDLVLLPALAVLIVVTWMSYRRYARTRDRR
jgi:mercuric ion transport protein